MVAASHAEAAAKTDIMLLIKEATWMGRAASQTTGADGVLATRQYATLLVAQPAESFLIRGTTIATVPHSNSAAARGRNSLRVQEQTHAGSCTLQAAAARCPEGDGERASERQQAERGPGPRAG